MQIRRALLYLMLVGALVVLLWALLPRPVEDNGASHRGETASRPGRGQSGRAQAPGLPALPSGDREPLLMTAVQGQVIDGDSGQGLAKVHVVFRAQGVSASGLTDEKGYYSVEVPGGTYHVSLESETHVSSLAEAGLRVQIEAGNPIRWLNFRMHRFAWISGQVVNAAAEPIAGAIVQDLRAHGVRPGQGPRGRVLSDAQGRFTLLAPPGEVMLEVDAGKRGMMQSSPLYVRPGARLEGVILRVEGGASLTGRVSGPQGQEVSGAQVVLQGPGGTHRSLSCDAKGAFAASELLPGATQLQGLARGFSPSPVVTVQLAAGQPASSAVLRLAASKGVGGAVFDGQGEPVAGVKISVRPGSVAARIPHLADPLQQTTAADGRFKFADVPETPLVITARGPGGSVATLAGVAPETYDNVLRLEGTGSIIGHVSDATSGDPIRDFTVAIVGVEGLGNPYAERPALRVTSASGTYGLDGLAAGTYAIAVSAPGYGTAEKEKLVVAAGYHTQAHVMLEAGGRIAGIVVDSRSVGIPGAEVQVDTGWSGEAVLTDAAGHFVLRDIARGRRSLTVSHPQYDTRIISGIAVASSATADVRVELTPQAGRGPGLTVSGVGAELARQDGRLLVVKALPGSPAAIAGLQAGDQILSIDGVHKERFADAIEAIRGITGTPVRLEVQRGKQRFVIDVLRGEVTIPAQH